MTSGSVDNRPWRVATPDREAGLEIVAAEGTFVLPWSQFLYAVGDDENVRLAFSTHDVMVKGSRLGLLMGDISEQRVTVLRAPARVEGFASDALPKVTGISVQEVE